MKKLSILIAEDEKNLSHLLERVLLKEGYNIFLAADGEVALEIIKANKIDIVLTDIKMPKVEGMALLKQIKEMDASIEVIVMTAFATIDTAINALKMGARDYIRKPFDIDEIVDAVNKTSMLINSATLNGDEQFVFSEMLVANSSKMKELIKMVKKVSGSVANIYIQGETGVGKELIAHAIHELSDRSENPFIKVTCSALPETLLESELFGYEKGAFTGAFARKLGRFELANGGTIFLDEIGDISPLIQLKLLRIIQQKELERLGGTQTISLDVRIITATNKDLEQLVKEGIFREDLYYRLNVIPLTVPALRERSEDIRELIETFMSISSSLYQTKPKAIEPDALDALVQYPWPGNVRELENIIERILIISEGPTIRLEDLPPKILKKSTIATDSLEAYKESLEADILKDALEQCQGNITKAAEKLGISRRSLHRKINKYNLNE